MVITPEPVTGNIWYVKPNGTGDKNGTSWEHAFATRQEAVDAASYGDHIRVWTGTYYLESKQYPKPGVSEYYGFNDDGSWAKRNPFVYPSIHDASFTDNNYENTSVTFLAEQVVNGIWVQNVVSPTSGGGIIMSGNKARFYNATTAMNSAPLGDNFYISGSQTMVVCNCISWGGTIYVSSSNDPIKIYNCASNFPITGVANWDTNADIRNFIPLSTFPFVSTGDTSYDNSGAFYHVNILGRTELALEFINNKLLPNIRDLHLPGASPLIGAGYYEAGVTPDLDADGTVRPLPPSIGAYEYVP